MSPPPRWVCHLSDDLPSGTSDATLLLGGKGAGLRRLLQAGYEVPPGFIITTDAFRRYLEAGRSLPESVWLQVVDGVKRLERETGCEFGKPPRPLLLAVRSGAPRSMPGVLDTLLNCGLTKSLAESTSQQTVFARFVRAFAASERDLPIDPIGAQHVTGEPDSQRCRWLTGESFPEEPWEQLRRSICAVMKSWQRPRAVRYRRVRGLTDAIGTAVIVQAMCPSEVSGVLFTREPQRAGGQRMVVEAVPGLGEKLVSGWTTPQRFFIPRDDLNGGTVDPLSPGSAPAKVPNDGGQRGPLLSSAELRTLGELGLRLETEFELPVDVEWAVVGGRFKFLQVRPIGDTPSRWNLAEARDTEIARLRDLARGRQTLWVRHNLAEGLPAPTPLTWDIVRRFMSGSGGFGRLYRDLGYAPARVVCEQGFLELVCGRIYADAGRLAELFVAGLPLRYDQQALVEDPSLIERAPTEFDPSLTSGWFFLQLPWLAWVLWRARRRMQRAGHGAGRRFDLEVLPEFLAYVERERKRVLPDCDQGKLNRLLRQRIDRVLHRFAPETLRPGLLGSHAFAALEEQLAELIGVAEGASLARRMISGLETDPRVDQDAWLSRVARGQTSLQEFLDRFGHRAAGEMELAQPRWREDRWAVQQLVDWLRTTQVADPGERFAQARSDRQAAISEMHRRIEEEGATSLLPRIEIDLSLASQLIPYRETGKHYLMLGYELIRQVVEEFGRRSELAGDVYFLVLDELERLADSGTQLRERAVCRRQRWVELQRIAVPEVVDSDQLELLGQAPAPDAAGPRLKGAPLSSGRARGPALIVGEPQAVAPARTGYVLVCPAIDPGYTPLLLGASGLLVEVGGLLSHGAVVARQFGIPAVACPGIMHALRPSAMVVVDGDAGQVILE